VFVEKREMQIWLRRNGLSFGDGRSPSRTVAKTSQIFGQAKQKDEKADQNALVCFGVFGPSLAWDQTDPSSVFVWCLFSLFKGLQEEWNVPSKKRKSTKRTIPKRRGRVRTKENLLFW